MLSHFKQLEEKKRDIQTGPKPLKRFTPPPDGGRGSASQDSEPGKIILLSSLSNLHVTSL